MQLKLSNMGKIEETTINIEDIYANPKSNDALFILFDLQYADKDGNPVDCITYTRNHMNYVLAYNEENYLQEGETTQTKNGIKRQQEMSASHHRNALYKTVRKLAKEEFVLFGLDQFRNYLFKNVYAYTQKEFEQKYCI